MNSNYSKVITVGRPARGLLARDHTALVMGITSRGMFLRLPSDYMVFITDEQYRGPLTLNLKKGSGSLGLCRPGDAAAVLAGRIRFDPGSFGLDYRAATAWDAPEISATALPVEERIAIVETVAHRVLSARPAAGLSALLVRLLELINQPELENDPNLPNSALAWLQRALEIGDVEAALAAAEPFLGLGSGLTPSGDDLLSGLLLALNRWGGHLEFHFNTQGFNRGVLEIARRRTTTLSANLLDCAANGQADERLIAALDGLFTGQPSPDGCADRLLTWGSSSGCDAFVGMALAVLVLSSFPLRSSYAH